MKRSSPLLARGSILLLVLVVSAVVITVTVSFLGYFGSAVQSGRYSLASAQALALAEAGIDTAVYKLNQDVGYAGEGGAALGNGTFNISIASIDSNTKRITVTSFVPNSTRPTATKTIQATVSINSSVVSFHYGIQIGQGGFEMNNSSKVIGNAYSNGNIIGTNSARIQGTAIAAGPTGIIEGMDIDGDSWSHTIRGISTVGGNAVHAVLQNTTVAGNVVADAISSCAIGGTATYDTRSSCTVTGAVTTPNTATFVPADVLPLPISEEQIDEWEQEAEAGGTLVGDQIYDTGTLILGPKKINGSLILSNTAELVITGTLWVIGDIKLSNNVIARLDAAYGSASGVVIAGVDESEAVGYIEISNFAQALGSGASGSYIMLLSQKEGTESNAIRTHNNSETAILYAGEGQVEVGNSAALKEITAYKLRITNNATVTYESGLQSANFSNGPGGSWTFVPGTYAITR
ncbi:MAG: hypothetical protein Q7R58_00825 [bacterium]|nr:hypothetical protein [bacterium]